MTAIHTKRHKEGELVYPYLRTLLHFDTQGLLNVLSIAFEEPEFQSELGRCQKQRLVDHLLEIMVHQDSSRHSFSPSQVSFLGAYMYSQVHLVLAWCVFGPRLNLHKPKTHI